MQITTCKDHPIALLFTIGSPYLSVWVTIHRMHLGDGQKVLLWQGKVRSVSWKASKGEVTISADPVEKVISKSGLRQTFSPLCYKNLYSTRCGVREADHTLKFTLTAASADGFRITSPEFATKPSQYFQLGAVYFQSSGENVMVLDHTGDTLTLKSPIKGLMAGVQGRAVAGCNHLWRSRASADVVLGAVATGTSLHDANLANLPDGDCQAKFNNLVNFGGFPYVPTKNPYQTNIAE